jgi:hypothetical protein
MLWSGVSKVTESFAKVTLVFLASPLSPITLNVMKT